MYLLCYFYKVANRLTFKIFPDNQPNLLFEFRLKYLKALELVANSLHNFVGLKSNKFSNYTNLRGSLSNASTYSIKNITDFDFKISFL